MRTGNLRHRQVEGPFAGGSVVPFGGGGCRCADPAGCRGLAVLGETGIQVLEYPGGGVNIAVRSIRNSRRNTQGSLAWVATVILWVVAVFYAYGALVHILNIAGFSDFSWIDAPLKWQVLDVIYLVIDVVVAIGLPLGWVTGYVAFFSAAGSQIVLYTLLRDWILDVPEAFARSPQDVEYLDGLVAFHLVTLVAVVLALWIRRNSVPTQSG